MLEATDAARNKLRAAQVPMLPLEACGLTFADRGRLLVDGITLRLQRGPRTVIMGPNGAGKSLLLRLLHGLVAPTSGRITWAGEPANKAVRARQAMVFQRPTLLRRSVEANIRFVLSGLSTKEARERTEQILARAGLTHLAQAPARLLSGGEQQRLAIARALALDPAVLFLDEPCSSLDPASTYAVEEMIEMAHLEGTKIVIITHDIGQAKRLADEVVFLHRGRLVEQSAAAKFFNAPCAPAAQAFLEGRLPL